MSFRLSFAAAVAFTGMAALAAPAFALQTIHVPDPSTQAQGDGPPDALFDKSIPDSWQKKPTDDNKQQGLGSFHFTVSGSSGTAPIGSGFDGSPTASGYGAANQPGSEFYHPLPGYSDPYFPH
jgi:hypothetical protein